MQAETLAAPSCPTDASAEAGPSRDALVAAFDAIERARVTLRERADQLNGVAELRDRIAEIGRRIAEVSGMAPSSADAARLMAGVVERLSLSDAEWAAHASQAPASAQDGVSLTVRRIDLTMAFVGQLLTHLLALVPDSADADAPGPSVGTGAPRAARLAALERERLDAELAEESIIREAEASGFPIRRRADASPVAVLARSEDLPQ